MQNLINYLNNDRTWNAYRTWETQPQLADPNTEISEKLSSDALFTMLNAGLDKFVKTRYSGLNVKVLGLKLHKNVLMICDHLWLLQFSSITDNTITLPTDYLLTLGETAGISSTTRVDGLRMGKLLLLEQLMC